MTSLKTLLRNTAWRRHSHKISLSKSDISLERLYHSKSGYSKKLMVSASEFLGVEKLMSFSLMHRKQKLTRTVTLICWRLPYCLNVVDFIQVMTLTSCKAVLRHTVQKWCNSFYDETRHRLHSCWWMGIMFFRS